MKIWGYWATLGWAILAYALGQIVALVAVLWLLHGDLSSLAAAPYDGKFVLQSTLPLNLVVVAVALIAVRFARANPRGYLALVLPKRREVVTAVACLVLLIAASDALLFVTGQPVVTAFQLQSYTSAVAEGLLPALLIVMIVVAPAGEEILFRGFLFRGFVRPGRPAWPGIAATAVLFAVSHVQYDWVGILQIFVIGLFLGVMRWRSGSTLLTFFLHALINLEAAMETVVQVHFFAK
ncbi:MAG TPA: CPBP family intramembrane glutamic endopeptidase [Pseudolabrys sp.]|nr:CPBP family intramembrane glutamic endopeptidase [Pseudolabrys sp.]